ncbi:hypothetical protein M1437_00365 [Patescibacteria group bacterium]|nr:hypothetical protein [Patescibacteria group bacterium]
MTKKILITSVLFIFAIFLFINPVSTYALNQGDNCHITKDEPNGNCNDPKLFCQPTANQLDPRLGYIAGTCESATVRNTFGKVDAPAPLKTLLKNDPTGGGAISQFLSNFVTLLFSVAAIVLIFMIIWGAFEWLTSGGDKEKLSSAQKRIINAIIGIILFAVAFAIIRVLGQFTGFEFFRDQNPLPNGCVRDASGIIICPYGT